MMFKGAALSVLFLFSLTATAQDSPNIVLLLSDDQGWTGTRILIEFAIEDPEYLAEPFAGSVEWYYAPHFEMLGFGCNADVSRRYTLQ